MSRVGFTGTFILFTILIGTPAFEIPDVIIRAATIIHNTCRDQVGVTEETLEQVKIGDWPTNREFQCYVACLFREIDVIDTQGHINFSHIYYLLPDEITEVVDGITKHCGTIHGVDACETAWLTAKCYFDADPQVKHIVSIFDKN